MALYSETKTTAGKKPIWHCIKKTTAVRAQYWRCIRKHKTTADKRF